VRHNDPNKQLWPSAHRSSAGSEIAHLPRNPASGNAPTLAALPNDYLAALLELHRLPISSNRRGLHPPPTLFLSRRRLFCKIGRGLGTDCSFRPPPASLAKLGEVMRDERPAHKVAMMFVDSAYRAPSVERLRLLSCLRPTTSTKTKKSAEATVPLAARDGCDDRFSPAKHPQFPPVGTHVAAGQLDPENDPGRRFGARHLLCGGACQGAQRGRG
jgi:hypothetical protein